MAQVKIPTMMRPLVGGERVLPVEGGQSLGVLLREVDARHPGFGSQIIDSASGQLRSYVNIYLNDEDVRYLQGLETPVEDDDVISILPAVAGGFV
jgi:sulfur-carrier protein